MSLDALLLFALTVFIASIIPGPSMLLALTHGMQHGAKKTLASALGNVTVTFIQALVSIAGLGTILIASETVFWVIKWAGAAYLVYLGISVLLSPAMSIAAGEPNIQATNHSARKMFGQAALVTAGNPKAIIFFTAIFPQFFNPEVGYLYQFSLLLSILVFIAFCCFMIYAVGGQKIVAVFSAAAIGKYIKRIIGCTFIGAGIGLAVSHK